MKITAAAAAEFRNHFSCWKQGHLLHQPFALRKIAGLVVLGNALPRDELPEDCLLLLRDLQLAPHREEFSPKSCFAAAPDALYLLNNIAQGHDATVNSSQDRQLAMWLLMTLMRPESIGVAHPLVGEFLERWDELLLPGLDTLDRRIQSTLARLLGQLSKGHLIDRNNVIERAQELLYSTREATTLGGLLIISRLLDDEENDIAIGALLPRIVSLMRGGSDVIVADCLQIISQIPSQMNEAIQAELQNIVHARLTLPRAPERGVLSVLQVMLETGRNPGDDDVVEYVTRGLEHEGEDEDYTRDVAECLSAFVENRLGYNHALALRIPRIVPRLIRYMQYTDSLVIEKGINTVIRSSGASIDLRAAGDLPIDLLTDPRQRIGPRAFAIVAETAAAPRLERLALVDDGEEEGEAGFDLGEREDPEDGGDDDDENAIAEGWNRRKACASALDNMSSRYLNDMTPALIETLTRDIQSSQTLVREAAVLAIGAVSSQLGEGPLQEFIVSLHPQIMAGLTCAENVVREITSWTLTRIQGTFDSTEQAGGRLLISRICDVSEEVRKAAMSGLAALSEDMQLTGAAFDEAFSNVRRLLASVRLARKEYMVALDVFATMVENLDRGGGDRAVCLPNLQWIIAFVIKAMNNRLYTNSRCATLQALGTVVKEMTPSEFQFTQELESACFETLAATEHDDADEVAVAIDTLAAMASAKPDYGAPCNADRLFAINDGRPLSVWSAIKSIMLLPDAQSPDVLQSVYAFYGDVFMTLKKCDRLNLVSDEDQQLILRWIFALQHNAGRAVYNNVVWCLSVLLWAKCRVDESLVMEFLDRTHRLNFRQQNMSENIAMCIGFLWKRCDPQEFSAWLLRDHTQNQVQTYHRQLRAAAEAHSDDAMVVEALADYTACLEGLVKQGLIPSVM